MEARLERCGAEKLQHLIINLQVAIISSINSTEQTSKGSGDLPSKCGYLYSLGLPGREQQVDSRAEVEDGRGVGATAVAAQLQLLPRLLVTRTTSLTTSKV